MIPADHITFNDDTAWWVKLPAKQDGITDPNSMWMFDRPCDTCGGDCEDGPNYHTPIAWHCPDCIDGRHTFEINVDCCGLAHDVRWPKTYRVSIVPGMVLPIWAASHADGVHGPHVCPWWMWVGHAPLHGQPGPKFTMHTWDGWQPITLPPAAKPGMWAVQLRLTPENVEEPK